MNTENTYRPLTCERCGRKTDAGHWMGFVYVGVECLSGDDWQDIEEADRWITEQLRESLIG